VSVISLERVRHLREAEAGVPVARVEATFFRVEDGTLVAHLRVATDPDYVESPAAFASANAVTVAILMERLLDEDELL